MAANHEDFHRQAFEHLAQAIALLAQAGGLSGDGGERWPAAMTVDVVCKYLSVSETQVRRLIAAGSLPPGFDHLGRPHWHKSDLDKYLLKIKRSKPKK